MSKADDLYYQYRRNLNKENNTRQGYRREKSTGGGTRNERYINEVLGGRGQSVQQPQYGSSAPMTREQILNAYRGGITKVPAPPINPFDGMSYRTPGAQALWDLSQQGITQNRKAADPADRYKTLPASSLHQIGGLPGAVQQKRVEEYKASQAAPGGMGSFDDMAAAITADKQKREKAAKEALDMRPSYMKQQAQSPVPQDQLKAEDFMDANIYGSNMEGSRNTAKPYSEYFKDIKAGREDADKFAAGVEKGRADTRNELDLTDAEQAQAALGGGQRAGAQETTAMLSDDEKQNYYYIAGTQGKKDAENYRQHVIQKRGLNEEIARRNQEAIAREMSYQTPTDRFLFESGTQFILGTGGALDNMSRVPAALTGDTSYRAEGVGQHLSQNMTDAVDTSTLSGKAYKTWLQLMNTSGNNAVSIAGGVAFGPGVGSALFAAQAAGDAYQQVINEGGTVQQAQYFAAMQAIDEEVTNALLGGIAARGGGLLKDALGNTAVARTLQSAMKGMFVNNPVGLRIANGVLDALANGGSEALQEYVQYFSEKFEKWLATGEAPTFNVDGKPMTWDQIVEAKGSAAWDVFANPEALESALMGFLNAGMMNGIGSVGRTADAWSRGGALSQDSYQSVLDMVDPNITHYRSEDTYRAGKEAVELARDQRRRVESGQGDTIMSRYGRGLMSQAAQEYQRQVAENEMDYDYDDEAKIRDYVNTRWEDNARKNRALARLAFGGETAVDKMERIRRELAGDTAEAAWETPQEDYGVREVTIPAEAHEQYAQDMLNRGSADRLEWEGDSGEMVSLQREDDGYYTFTNERGETITLDADEAFDLLPSGQPITMYDNAGSSAVETEGTAATPWGQNVTAAQTTAPEAQTTAQSTAAVAQTTAETTAPTAETTASPTVSQASPNTAPSEGVAISQQPMPGTKRLAQLAGEAGRQSAEQRDAQWQAVYEAGKNRDSGFQSIMDGATMLSEAEKTAAFNQGMQDSLNEVRMEGQNNGREEGNLVSGEGSERNVSLRAGERTSGVQQAAGRTAEAGSYTGELGGRNGSENGENGSGVNAGRTGNARPVNGGSRSREITELLEGAADKNVRSAAADKLKTGNAIPARSLLRTATPGQTVIPVYGGDIPSLRKSIAMTRAYDPSIMATPFISKGEINVGGGQSSRAFADPVRRQLGFRMNDEGATGEQLTKHELIEFGILDGKIKVDEAYSTIENAIPERILNGILECYFADQIKGHTSLSGAEVDAAVRQAKKEMICDIGAGIDQVSQKFSNENTRRVFEKANEIANKALKSYLNERLNNAFGADAGAVSDADVISMSDKIALKQAGIELNEDGTVAHMAYSTRFAWRTEEQQKKAVEALQKALKISKKKAEAFVRSEMSLTNLILSPGNVVMDFDPDQRYSAIKKNSDYPQGTVDFNNNCRKRVPFTEVFNRLQKRNPNRVFTAEDLEIIRQEMIKHNVPVACALCYVEERRQRLGEIAEGFIELYKNNALLENFAGKKEYNKIAEALAKSEGDGYQPTVYDLITYDGLKKLDKDHKGIAEAFKIFNNARGMQSGRLVEGRAEYKRELLKYTAAQVKRINDLGGLRVFSYSDFEAVNLLDLVQIIQDASIKGIKIQAYTKVPAFAKVMRNTGAKVNRSLIARGTGIRYENGQAVLDLDPVEGININDPDFFDSTDDRDIGNILVGMSDEQIRLAMATDFVDYIIPFHTSLPNTILKAKGIDHWTNYKLTQNERDKATGVKAKNVNIYTDVLQAAEKEGKPIRTKKQFVNKFLEVCKERNLIPRFSQFLDMDKNGNYVYTEGYHKFLIDFKLFDKNGRIVEQQTVRPEFDDAYNTKLMEDFANGVGSVSISDEMYKDVVKALNEQSQGDEVQYSAKLSDGKVYRGVLINESDHEYSKDILTGLKKGETRDKVEPFLENAYKTGERIALIRSGVKGERNLNAYATAKIGKPEFISESEWDSRRNDTRVPRGSMYDKMGNIEGYGIGKKYYPLIDVRRLDQEVSVTSHSPKYGRFSQGIDIESAADDPNNANVIRQGSDQDIRYSSKLFDKDVDERLRVRMATLFSGAGTVDFALRSIVQHEFAVEFKDKIAAVYRANNGGTMYVKDIQTVNVDPHKGRVEYLHISPVCTDYSNANNKQGERDIDLKTAEAAARIIDNLQPKVITVENVRRYKNSRAVRIIEEALERNGYLHDKKVYRASNFGGATIRERMFIRAVKDGVLPKVDTSEYTPMTWYDAVKDMIPKLPPAELSNYMRGRLGVSGIDIDNLKQPVFVLGGEKSGELTFATADKPAPTILAKSTEAKILMPDGRILRATPRVMARIQGLPDEFDLGLKNDYDMEESRGNVTNAYRVVGNGVPVQLTQGIVGPLLEENLIKQKSEATGIQYSSKLQGEIDEQYDTALRTNDMDAAAKLVKKAAADAGYTEELYHGTTAFGFTKFELSKMDDGASIFATSDKKIAETYSGETTRNLISERAGEDHDSIIARINKTKDRDLLPLLKKHLDSKYEQLTQKRLDEMRSERIDAIRFYADRISEYIDEHEDDLDEITNNVVTRIASNLYKTARSTYTGNPEGFRGYLEDPFEYYHDTDELRSLDENVLNKVLDGENGIESLNKSIMSLNVLLQSDVLFAGGKQSEENIGGVMTPDGARARLYEVLTNGIYHIYGKNSNMMEIDANSSEWDEIDPALIPGYTLGRKITTREVSRHARFLGYDGVILRNLKDSGGATEYNRPSDIYIYFNTNAVKSADAVTYDNNGNVIPLSERFNQKNEDIRYSSKLQMPEGLTEKQQKNFQYNESKTETGDALRTLHNGSRIGRSKYGVGKNMAKQFYVHKDYAEEIVPKNELKFAKDILADEYPDFKYNCIMYDPSRDMVRFDEAPDFDTAREPMTGDYVSVNVETGDAKKGHSNYIWHHKWQWVKNDYKGFDVRESWEWSKEWLNTLMEAADGNGIGRWNAQLDKYGLPHDGDVQYSSKLKNGQKQTGEDTSVLQIPGTFTHFEFPAGTRILDYGGGQYNLAKDAVEKTYPGVSVEIMDAFNRTSKHNDRISNMFDKNKADAVTVNNVLNVIDSREARHDVIEQAKRYLKKDGVAYFLNYQADKNAESGEVKGSQKDESRRNYQTNMEQRAYIPEIKEVFKYCTEVKSDGDIYLLASNIPLTKDMYKLSDQKSEEVKYLKSIKGNKEEKAKYNVLSQRYGEATVEILDSEYENAANKVLKDGSVGDTSTIKKIVDHLAVREGLDKKTVRDLYKVKRDADGNVIPLSQRVEIHDENIRYSSKLSKEDYAPTFYSKLQREVQNFKGEKIGAASVESYLKGKGVKDEEIKWSGIRTFLEGKKSVNKQELMQYLRDNEMEIEQTILDDNPVFVGPDVDGKERAFRSIEEIQKVYADKYGEDILMNEDYDDYMEQYSFSIGDEDYSFSKESSGDNETHWEGYRLDGGENYREILFRIPGSNYSNQAMSTHWNESGVLAHARVQDFDAADGGKVLFVEEIQSDWHNAGQKEGYRGDKVKSPSDLKDAEKAYKEKGTPLIQKISKILTEEYGIADRYADTRARRMVEGNEPLDRMRKSFDEEMDLPFAGETFNTRMSDELYDTIKEAREYAKPYLKAVEEQRRQRLGGGLVPDAPFRTTYTDYVLKNLLRMAAEGDYDYLAWTTGKMQEERWRDEFAEGYRIEYDQQIPKFLKKYGKQWGSGLQNVKIYGGWDRAGNAPFVPAIVVNDAMKKSVLTEGQPMYSSKNTGEIDEKALDPRRVFISYNPDLQNAVREISDVLTAYQELAPTQAEIKRTTRQIAKKFGSHIDVEAAARKMETLYNFLAEGGRPDGREVLEISMDIANDILDEATHGDPDAEERWKKFKQEMRKRRIYIPKDRVHDLNPDGIRALRRQWKGKMVFTTDEKYRERYGKIHYIELQQMFPEYFTKNADNMNDIEAIEEIMFAFDAQAPVYEQIYTGATRDEAALEIAYDIMQGYFGNYDAQQRFKKIYRDYVKPIKDRAIDDYREKLRSIELKDAAAVEQRSVFDQIKGMKGSYVVNEKALKDVDYQGRQAMMERLREKAEQDKKRYEEQIEKVKAGYVERSQKDRLMRLAKELRAMKGGPEFEAKKKELIGDLDLIAKGISYNYERKLMDMKEEYEKLAEEDPNFEPDRATIEKIKRLQKKQINQMTSYEITALTEAILKMKQDQWTHNRMIRETDAALVADEGRRIVNETNALKGTKGMNRLADAIDGYSLAHLNSKRAFRKMSGYNDKSGLMKLWNELNEGQHKTMDFHRRAEAPFDEFMADAENKEFIQGMFDPTVEITSSKIEFEDENGNVVRSVEPKTVKITPAMKISIYLHSLNQDNREHAKYGGFRIPNMDKYERGDYSNAYGQGSTRIQLTKADMQNIASTMTPQELRFADLAHDYFNKTSKEAINEASMLLNGYELASVENYMPIKTDPNFTKKDISGLIQDGTIEGQGWTKDRNFMSKNPILLEDITQVLQRSIDGAALYYGLAIPIRNFNKVYNFQHSGYTDSVKEAIMQTFGKRGNEYIDKLIRDLQGGNMDTKDAAGKWVDRFTSGLRGNYAQAILTLNPSVAIKQAASYPTAAARLGFEPLRKALAKLPTSTKEDMDLINKYTPLLWYRAQGQSSDALAEVSKRKDAWEYKGGVEKTRQMFNWIQNIDVKTVKTLWYASEYYVQDNMPSFKEGTEAYYREVAKVFNEVVEDTQPNYTTMQRASISRVDNEIMKAVFMFKTQPLQNVGILYDSIMEYQAKQEAFKQAVKNGFEGDALNEYAADMAFARQGMMRSVASITVSTLVFSAMTQLAKLLLHRVDPLRDEGTGELTKTSILKNFFGNAAESVAGMLAGAGEIYSLIMAMATGSYLDNLSVSGIDSLNDTMTKMLKTYQNIGKIMADEETSNKEKVAASIVASRDLAIQIMDLTGIPANNAKKIAEALINHYHDVINPIFTPKKVDWNLESGARITDKQYANRALKYYQKGNIQKGDLAAAKMQKESAMQSALGAKGKKDEEGNSIPNSKKYDAIHRILRTPGSDEAKGKMFAAAYPSDELARYMYGGGSAYDFMQGQMLAEEIADLSEDEKKKGLYSFVEETGYTLDQKKAWLVSDKDRLESKKLVAWRNANGTDWDFIKHMSNLEKFSGSDDKKEKIVAYIKRQTSDREKQKALFVMAGYQLDSTKDGKTVKDGNFKKSMGY